VRSVLVVALLAGCARHLDRCDRIRAREIALADPEIQPIIRSSTDTPAWRATCRARYTDETLACFERAKDSSALADCPVREVRAPEDIPDADQCQALVTHVRELGARLDDQERDHLAAAYALSCRRDLKRAEVACDLGAADAHSLAACTRPR
jgi:hypothetical protein